MTRDDILVLIEKMAIKIEADKDMLTELDNVIGDGDHGINMARGFAEVIKKLPDLKDKDIGAILKSVGMTLVSTVGGASGPLYGTAFMKAGSALNAKETIDIQDFIVALEAARDGIVMRGKATTGEKTMLDSICPSIEAMKQESQSSSDAKSILKAGVQAAKDGIEYTKTIKATKGRASYLGDRSIGHQDPGATSYTDLLEVIEEFVN